MQRMRTSRTTLCTVLHVKKNMVIVLKVNFFLLSIFKLFEATYSASISKLTFVMVFGPCPPCVCLFICVCVCVSLICLALILAAIRTMPCIRKHAGVGLESRSGLENNVGTLLRPDFLLSLAMCYLSPKATARSHPSCLLRNACLESLGMMVLLKRLHGLLAQM